MPQLQSDTEHAIAGLAACQHGVVTRRQLLDAGLSPDAIDRRLRWCRLRVLHRGVYAVGPLPLPREREMAAVLACAARAVLSHRSAAAGWQLLPASERGPVELIARQGDPGRRPGLLLHRVRTLRADEITTLDGIPITTVPRTLLDLASREVTGELERAVAQALRRGLTDHTAILAVLARHPRRRGTARLRVLFMADVPPGLTRSVAEERFVELVVLAQLPRPELNVRVCGFEVDFFWRAERLIVEIDGFAFHSSAGMFESDRRRDAVLAAAGLRVMRVTWRQLVREPEAIVARVAQALAQGGRP